MSFTKPFLIVTIMTGYDPSYRYAKKSFENYAKKCNADLYVIDRKIIDIPKLKSFDFSRHAWAQKLLLGTFLVKYERVLYVDADIVITPNAPDLFQIYPKRDHVYMFNEGAIEDRTNEHDIIKRFSALNNESLCELGFYYNAGVILFSRESNFLSYSNIKNIDFFIENSKFYEQTYFNYLIAKNSVLHEGIEDKFNRMIISGPSDARFDSYFIHHAAGSYSKKSKFKIFTLISDYCDLYKYKLNMSDYLLIVLEATGFYFRRYLKKAFL